MSVFNSLPPKINQNHLIMWLKENYSFLSKTSFKMKALNSERDKNFLINISNNEKYVLKISNFKESKERITKQLLNLEA